MKRAHSLRASQSATRLGAGDPVLLNVIPIHQNGFRGRSNNLRQRLYDILVGSVTHMCYDAGLNYFSEYASVLDVGIGNGFMIPRFHELIKSKQLHITGIDISAGCLAECARRIKNYGLQKRIELHRTSIESFQPRNGQQFDFIFFSQTFMLMRDQKEVLRCVRRLIAPGGEIVFFQTLHNKKRPILDLVKPQLKYFIGIDFGIVSYENHFLDLLADENLWVLQDRLLHQSFFQWSYRIITAAPEPNSSSAARGPGCFNVNPLVGQKRRDR